MLETDIIQCIAQGVPANFVEYIANEVKEALDGNREFVEDSEYECGGNCSHCSGCEEE